MKKKIELFDIIILMACILPIVLISASTTLYLDDFFYATFFKDGFSEFIHKNISHYMNTNGRAFVHILLQIVLVFRDGLFFAVIPIMLWFSFWTFSKLVSSENKRIGLLYYALCFMGVMCIPVSVLREGMLWMAGAFNYIFPLGMAITAVLLTARSAENTKWWYYPIAFLAGATTEQCGMIAVGASGAYILWDIIKNRRVSIKAILLVVIMVAGYMTLILSPSTSQRLGTEIGYNLSYSERFSNIFKMALSGGNLFIFSLAVFVAAKKKLLTFLGLVIVVFLSAAERYIACGALFTLIVIAVSVHLLLTEEKPYIPIMLISSLGSVLMLVASSSFGFRNILPSLLIMILIISSKLSVAFDNIAHFKRFTAAFVCLLISVSVFMPTLKGYLDNRNIINENIKQLCSGSDVHYNTEINRIYGYKQFYEDYGLHYKHIKKVYNISDSRKIFLSGKGFYPIIINSEQIENPAYKDGNDIYYPVRCLIDALGGSVEFDGRNTVVKLNGREANINIFERKIYDGNKQYPDEYILKGKEHEGYFASCLYISKKAFSEIFGVEIPVKE